MTSGNFPPLKALIIEDSRYIARQLGIIMSSEEIEVVATAANGSEVLKKYSKHQPDFVIMDINRPEAASFKTLRQLVKLDPHAIVIAVHALGKEALGQQALRAGAVRCVPKPLDPELILEVLHEVFPGPPRGT